MCDALGIIISSSIRGRVKGIQDYRPLGAFSFMGRYRVIDFPLSNFSNSDIDHIQVYVRENPRSLAEHLSNASSFDINSKKGKLQLLFSEKNELNDIYNTDIAAFEENINIIKRSRQQYVIVVPSYMIYKQDFSQLVQEHIDSGADVSVLYQHVNNAKEAFINCNTVELNKQKGVLSISRNSGTANSRNILLDTAIMSKEVFLDLIDKAHKLSAMCTLGMIISEQAKAGELDIRGIAHRGYVATVTDLRSYLEANLNLLDPETSESLFTPDWPIYTVTTDAPPTRYIGDGDAVNSVVSNGCTIKGHVENCVIGRGVTIEEGAVVRNSVVLAYSRIGKDVSIDYQVIDKWVQIRNAKQLIGSKENPGYIKRDDIL